MLKIYVNISQMPKVIQVWNVPDDVYREAKTRAGRAGLSLSDYLLRELANSLAVPPVDVVLARIAARDRPQLAESPAEVVRAERELRCGSPTPR